MVALAKERGLRLRGHRSQPVSDTLLRGVEQVFAMERQHLDALAELCPAYDGYRALIDPLGEEIPDPYFGSRADVLDTFERLEEVCAMRAREWADSRGDG
jgi:protein-tyrosine-phosphatase